MQASPAISVNGGRLPEEFIAKVMSDLPEELELLDMLMRLNYTPEAELPKDEALRNVNSRPELEIREKFFEIMEDLEQGNNFEGNLVNYLSLKRHDPAAFALLTHAAELTEAVNHVYDEFEWLINGDGHTQHEVWSLENSAPKLIPANPETFQ
jgi:hypothetical protein